ncbi:MAG: ABC transporter substrate-binding protein [Candidatus Promineifilaceae bacterium]|nr:ABC transporter substrate-binding protein [Candidatus Promineifilaceae bacterium]
MQRKRWYLLLITLLMSGLLLVACGADEEPIADEVEVEDIAEDDIDEDTGEVIDEGEDEDILDEEDVDVVEEEEEDVDVVDEEEDVDIVDEEEDVDVEEEEDEAEDVEGDMADPVALVNPECEGGESIKAIEALNPDTVQFTLCNPDPAFLEKIAFAAFAIWPSEYLEETGGTGELLENPIGTGPYMFEQWNRGDSIIFTRNPDYWGDMAETETLVFRWSSEGTGRLLELQAGTVDGIDNPAPGDYETIANDPNLQLIDRPGLNVFYLAMTNTFEPFDDPTVRRAIAMGIDRQRIVDNFYPGGSEVAAFFTPCDIPNACVGEEWYDYDPEAARELLAEAGYEDGFETTIFLRDVFRSYLPEPVNVAQEIQAQLSANLGIEANIEVMESGTFIAESTSGSLDGLYLLGWGADYPHVTNFLDFHFSEANPQYGETFPEIFEPLREGAQIADPAEAEPFYVEANNAIRELVPMVPIAHGASATAFLADVEDPHASPLGNEFFAVMSPGDRDTFVWMQNAEPISLFCADETDGESLRACEQVMEPLYGYEIGGVEVRPLLAEECVPNDDLTVWTCDLRDGVVFHDGSEFDASDVVASYALGLDPDNPLHVGNTGAFEYYSYLWGLIDAE